jgi:hypothetical protein
VKKPDLKPALEKLQSDARARLATAKTAGSRRLRERVEPIARRFRRKPPVERRTVLLLPPLLVPSPIMRVLAWRLRRAGYAPLVWSYASYRRDIPENAAALARLLARQKEGAYDVVAFSLGSIVLRWALNNHAVPAPRRVVMMGPPNRGAFMADWLHRKTGPLFPVLWGRCAMQLRRGAAGLCESAGTLPKSIPVGIIAGGRGTPRGFNPIIPGDNDLTVAVTETVLPGMADFTLVPLTHSLLPLHGRSGELVLRFLETGRFRPAKVPVAPGG